MDTTVAGSGQFYLAFEPVSRSQLKNIGGRMFLLEFEKNLPFSVTQPVRLFDHLTIQREPVPTRRAMSSVQHGNPASSEDERSSQV